MKTLAYIKPIIESYNQLRSDLKYQYETSVKLNFNIQSEIIQQSIRDTSGFVEILNDISRKLSEEKLFTESDISRLQSEVHKLTGDGEVMILFNDLLGIKH